VSQTATILNAVIPVFGVMALGVLIRRLNWLTEDADHSLMRICVNLLLPCLILDKSLGNPALSQPSNWLLGPLTGYLGVGLSLWVAWVLWPLHGLRESQSRRTFALCAGFHNYGYIPLPLALLLFDQATAGVLFLHIIGVETALWTLGVMTLTGGGLGRGWKKLINAPLVAIVVTVVLNRTGMDAHIPAVARTGFQWLGGCAIPLALILIGAIIADHLGDFQSTRGWRVMAAAVMLRLGLLPLIFLAAARFLPATLELKRVLILEAAMPTAVFPIVLAKLYRGDAGTAIRVVLATSVISLATIPLWLRFGFWWLGL